VGNWYDAAKAQELAREMIAGGVDVILPISGGANQGVLKAAKDSSIYLLWYDSNGYGKAPGTVLGSTAILQEKAAYEKTKEAIEGKIPFGEARIVGVEEGWIRFLNEDPLYREHVPENLRTRQAEIVEKLKSGETSLPMR
jgi:basic membrane lipoprotein Med (substrate-binding protein (PBP1-ABC) superfamily)